MEAIVVGISGIGKEYVRALQAFRHRVLALVDFPEVFDKEVQQSYKGRCLTNTFPGHTFKVELDEKTELISARSWTQIAALHPSHVFICTPPHAHAEALAYLSMPSQPIVHVEKPLAFHVPSDYESRGRLSVGYLGLAMPMPAIISGSYNFGCYAPKPEDWRKGQIWHDLLVHPMAMAGGLCRQLGLGIDLHDESWMTTEDKANGLVSKFGVHGAYVDNVANHGLYVNGNKLDWDTLFYAQLHRINDPTYRALTVDVATMIEYCLDVKGLK